VPFVPSAEQPTTRLSSVRNAARVLKEFSRKDRELGIAQLARRLGLAPSTVHRLVSTLADEGLLERGPGGVYRLGLQVHELGVTVFPSVGLHEASRPVLASLRHTTAETVQMGVLDGLDVVYVERLESPQTLRIFHLSGHRLPAHATSAGKVLLAHLPVEILHERLLDWHPTRLTPHTIANESDLLAELKRVAERGWAQNIEEGALGAASVAAPVRDEDGTVIAAISVVGPISRARRALPRHRPPSSRRPGTSPPGLATRPGSKSDAAPSGDRRRRALERRRRMGPSNGTTP
jgi:DNA-binding IclR family transcriptional regulator